MSILVVLIPPRPRSAGPGGDGASGHDYHYVLSPDGLAVASEGRAAATGLPRADSVVAVLPDCDVGWHLITLPKAPASRLRAVLAGLLEEALLEDTESTHFALAPGAVANQPAWVATANRRWLAEHLQVLEAAHRSVERVVPSSWPDEKPLGHFAELPGTSGAGTDRMTLVWSDAQGVACIALQGTLARAMLPQQTAQPARWTATPAVAAQAERWLGAAVMVLGEDQRALQSARTLWNLRQFDLAPRHRGARALRDAWLRFLSPAWRPARLGLAAFVLLNIIGLNLYALHQRAAVADKQKGMTALLQSTYPNVRSIIDAPAQMQRETDTLRSRAGKPGDGDLEVLMQAAASAWPPGQPPVETLRFEPGKLVLAAGGWSPEQVAQFRNQLRGAGWAVDFNAGQLTVSRAGGVGGRS